MNVDDVVEEPGWLKLGVASALTREFEADARGFLALLADTVERALPDSTERHMAGGWLAKKSLIGFSITINQDRYRLEDSGKGPLVATVTHIVRGIALKTETISVPEWLAEVGAAIDERLRTNMATRNALAEMLRLD